LSWASRTGKCDRWVSLRRGRERGYRERWKERREGVHNTQMCGRQARQQPRDVFRVVMVKSGNG